MAAGRPSKYDPSYCKLAFNYALLGATDKQMAQYFGVGEKTLNNWKDQHPEFLQSLKEGKEDADSKVSESLYNRAIGYSHKEDKIFNNNGTPLIVHTTKHYPPDPTAIIFWLKNRQPELWRDVQHIDKTITYKEDDTRDIILSQINKITNGKPTPQDN